MAEQPPNQTMISVAQQEYNTLKQENRIFRNQIQASTERIKKQAVEMATLDAQIIDKDQSINGLKQASQQLGLKGQSVAEDLARVQMDNNAFEEDNKKLTTDLDKANKKIKALENKVKKLESSKKG